MRSNVVMGGEKGGMAGVENLKEMADFNINRHQILQTEPRNPDLQVKSMTSLKYAFFICLILVSFGVNAQRYAVADGDWDDPIWASTFNGVAGTAATPTSSDNVFTNAHLVTIGNNDAFCRNLNVANLANSLTIADFSFKTLSVYGTMTGVSSTASANPSATPITISNALVMDGIFETIRFEGTGNKINAWGYINPFGNLTFNPGTSQTSAINQGIRTVNGTTLTIESGTVSISTNSVSRQIRGCSDCTLLINSSSTLNSASAINGGGTTGSDDPNTSFGSITVNGTLISTNYVNATNFTLGAGATFQTNYSGTEGWWYQSNRPSITVDATSTTILNGAAQSVYTADYGNLTLTNSGTKTVVGTGSVNVKGNLTFGNSGITLTSSRLFVFDGTNGQQVTGGGAANFNGGITINKSTGTLTIAEDISWQGQFNLAQGAMVFTNASTATVTGVASIAASIDPSFYNLTVSGTGTLTSSNANVNIGGNFINNGTFNANGGTLTFNGVSSQSINGSTSSAFSNITMTNGGSLTMSTPATLTGALTVSAGTFNANGNLTLISTSTTDARIAELPVSGAAIVGDITMQRYLSNNSLVKNYRYLASPFTDATVADWKAEFPVTGTFTDPSTAAQWSGQYPELVETDPSLYIYNEAHAGSTTINDRYESYPADGNSSSSPLTNGVGYAAYMREASPFTISWSGTPKTGLANVSVTAQSAGGSDGWNLIGNPYAAPIDWDNVTLPGAVSSSIALQDNTGRLTTAEYYVYYAGGVGTGGYNGIIAAGQAFWVRATSNATITFEENDKSATASPAFIREGVLPDFLRAKLVGNGGSDELVLYFKEGADDAGDNKFDAFKLANASLNFSSLSSDGKKLAINSMSKLSCDKEIALVVEGVTTGQYSINFSDFENVTAGVSLKLVDNFTGDTHTISSTSPAYVFNVTSVSASSAADRFKIKFTYPSVLANLDVQGGDSVCEGTNSKVTVSTSQQAVNYYASINGVAVSAVMAGNGQSLEIVIPHNNLAKGDNQVVVMAMPGSCNAVALSKTTKITTDALYPVSSVTANTVCRQGAVTLVASGAPVGGKYKWYESSDAINAIAGQETASFVTPPLNKTKTYFVATVNTLGCEGARKEAIAKVTTFDDATITQVDETTLQSNFETGNQWYLNDRLISGATSNTLTITQSGLYKLKVSIDGTCETSAERSMIVTGIESRLENGQVYPNPVNKLLSIKIPITGDQVAGSVQNDLGQSVGVVQFKEKDGAMYGEFDFEGRAPGIYIVRIAQGSSITNHKIVKK